MDKGFVWLAMNNSDVDYISLSEQLARSIKKHNKINSVTVITDKKISSEWFDKVVVVNDPSSVGQNWKMNDEWRVFSLSPYTHTIKLEADMLWTQNTDWWWHYLCQHEMIFSYHVRNYKDDTVANSGYRKLFQKNLLPDIYNGLTYFRRSQSAKKFYDLVRKIFDNWEYVKENVLINCHDDQATTDVCYALANKILDPLQKNRIVFDWFRFIHNKPLINRLSINFENDEYLYPSMCGDKIYVGGHIQKRTWHYHRKDIMEEINARVL